MKSGTKTNLILIAIVGILIATSYFFFFRIDLTTDKRFSISPLTKNLMKTTEATLKMTIYLDGDLNPGFQRLKKSTRDMLEEMSVYATHRIDIKFDNPSKADSEGEREKQYHALEAQGMSPTAIYERDQDGKAIQKIVFPWLKIQYRNKTVYVKLLKNIRGNSGAKNLNISIENLEYDITDGIRQVVNTKVSKIAFLEGQGELTDAQTYDITKELSHYFEIDRGTLSNDAAVLNNYKAIIIAKPTKPFSENDKFIIDQYIMNGGRVLWLVDGVRVEDQFLSTKGYSPAIPLHLNLSDMFFKYGVRIDPVILQDVQCINIPVNIAPKGQQPQFSPSPWYYDPLLLTSYASPITKNLTQVKSDFASAIETVGSNKNTSATLLLATSDNTHIVPVPAKISPGDLPNPKNKTYFNAQYVPVAILMQGEFQSDFQNRILPKGIRNLLPFRAVSKDTRQIFVADGDIIRNETTGVASDSTTLPLGYDRYSGQQFGNKDFITNAVLYLTDKDNWMSLRSRTFKLRMLNKKIVDDERIYWQIIDLAAPLILLLLFGVIYQFIRKRRFARK